MRWPRAEDKDLAVEIEDRPRGRREQLEQHLGIVRGRAQDVLLRPVVEDELDGERARHAALTLRPGGLVVRDLANPHLLLGPLFLLLLHCSLPLDSWLAAANPSRLQHNLDAAVVARLEALVGI